MVSPEISIQRTLKHEDSKLEGKVTTDTGGVTKWGISTKSYPSLDIKSLTLEEAVVIYQKDYWEPLQLDKIIFQDPVDVIFDFAVNSGRFKAVWISQRVLALDFISLTIDGKMGPQTISNINKIDPKKFVNTYCDLRNEFYRKLAKSKRYQPYLDGWLARSESYRIP